jgi:hypothetical protein
VNIAEDFLSGKPLMLTEGLEEINEEDGQSQK